MSRKTYAAQAKRFERDKTSVSTIGGYIIMAQLMCSVITNISAGRYDR